MKCTLALIAIVSLLLLMQGANAVNYEEKLAAALLTRYSKIARPVNNVNDNVTVQIGVSLIRIASVEKYSAEMEVWLAMNWKDYRLKWEKSDYGGLSTLAVPAELLWLPDIRPYNVQGYRPEPAIMTLISYDGRVMYVLPARIRFHCETLSNRSVACKVKLGSWVHSGGQIDMQIQEDRSFDLSDLMETGWDVLNTSARRESKKYPCCSEEYISVEYKVMLNKKSKKSKSEKSKKKSEKSKKKSKKSKKKSERSNMKRQ